EPHKLGEPPSCEAELQQPGQCQPCRNGEQAGREAGLAEPFTPALPSCAQNCDSRSDKLDAETSGKREGSVDAQRGQSRAGGRLEGSRIGGRHSEDSGRSRNGYAPVSLPERRGRCTKEVA